MPNRLKRHKNKVHYTDWSTDQDCLLIKNFEIPTHLLLQMLPYSEQQILDRKQVLGLIVKVSL